MPEVSALCAAAPARRSSPAAAVAGGATRRCAALLCLLVHQQVGVLLAAAVAVCALQQLLVLRRLRGQQRPQVTLHKLVDPTRPARWLIATVRCARRRGTPARWLLPEARAPVLAAARDAGGTPVGRSRLRHAEKTRASRRQRTGGSRAPRWGRALFLPLPAPASQAAVVPSASYSRMSVPPGLCEQVAELALDSAPKPPFAPLPFELAALIFRLLSVDMRLRCREVSRGWRDALEDHRLWEELDLSCASGVWLTPALLRAASLRAHGRVRTLDLSGWYEYDGLNRGPDFMILLEAMRDAAASSAGALVTLRLAASPAFFRICVEQVERLLQAAPLLTVLDCNVYCSSADAVRLLRNEPPFAPLRLREITVSYEDGDDIDVPAIAAAIASHASLSSVNMWGIPLATVADLDTLISAAVQRRLEQVEFYSCGLTPQSLPSLARLLAEGAVFDLRIHWNLPLFVDDAVEPFCTALRASKLVSIDLRKTCFWGSLDDAALVIAALAGHPTLKRLNLSRNRIAVTDAARLAVGTMLTSLVAGADATLEHLIVRGCSLGDDGARPLFQAVAASTVLRELSYSDNYIGSVPRFSAAFVREHILPAVRSNTSLRTLSLIYLYDEFGDECDEYDRVVEQLLRLAQLLVQASSIRTLGIDTYVAKYGIPRYYTGEFWRCS